MNFLNFAKVISVFSIMLVIIIGCSNSEKSNRSSSLLTEQKDTQQERSELFISAASSLQDAMAEIKMNFERNHAVKLTFNFGSSGKLAQQIEQGAPVDFFISANEYWMEQLRVSHLIEESTINIIAGNKLVLITEKESSIKTGSFEEIINLPIDQIAIGHPDSVPAGKYTKESLLYNGIWHALEDKFVFAQNVRQVLAYVETGNADVGFVYESDALRSDAVKVIAFSNPETHEPIVYQGALTTQTQLGQIGEEFMDYLLSTEVQTILEKHGFSPNE